MCGSRRRFAVLRRIAILGVALLRAPIYPVAGESVAVSEAHILRFRTRSESLHHSWPSRFLRLGETRACIVSVPASPSLSSTGSSPPCFAAAVVEGEGGVGPSDRWSRLVRAPSSLFDRHRCQALTLDCLFSEHAMNSASHCKTSFELQLYTIGRAWPVVAIARRPTTARLTGAKPGREVVAARAGARTARAAKPQPVRS